MQFTLPPPPSVNALFRNVTGVGRVKSTVYRDWAAVAMQEMQAQRSGQSTPKAPVAVTISMPDSKGRRDLDNSAKAVLDTLVVMGVLASDNDKTVRKITLQVGALPDRCTVKIEPLIETIPHEGKVS
jgi:Holliday junction resolvase RusA-like endonuclease